MAQVVRGDVAQAGRAGSGVEDLPAPVPEAQRSALRPVEQQVVGLLALAAARQWLGERRRQRNGALLMGLWGAELEPAGDLGCGFRDGQATAEEVDAAHSQCDHISKP